jgi:hypothetical protein
MVVGYCSSMGSSYYDIYCPHWIQNGITMTYEENVQRIAEEMARKKFPASEYEQPRAFFGYVQKEMESARIAVKHMAESVRYALENAVDNEICYTIGLSDAPLTDYTLIEKYLIEHALIPAEEGGK